MPEAGPPFRILTVCLGNICRSPLAAQLLTARLMDAGLHAFTTVESAGLGALTGEPMDALPAHISKRNGGNPAIHRAQQLSPALVASADLILTMTKAQRDALLSQHPRALHRTFSVGELVMLMAQGASAVPSTFPPDAAQRLRLKTLAMSRLRSTVRTTLEDDIEDPYRRGPEIHEAVGQQIVLASAQLANTFAQWAVAPAEPAPSW
jgi:protein-tyrosine phosphatase